MTTKVISTAGLQPEIATVWIEQLEGCTSDDVHHQWVQNHPVPQAIVVHAKAANGTKQPIPWASIGVFWPYENLEWRYSQELLSVEPGQSFEATFQLEPLRDGDLSALYFALFENSAPFLKQSPKVVPGTVQAFIIHTWVLWNALHTRI